MVRSLKDAGEVKMEPCSGCGEMADDHPMVGVTRDKESGEMAAFPVCESCHRDPAHRQITLKMHFFPRAQRDIAVARAGKGDIG